MAFRLAEAFVELSVNSQQFRSSLNSAEKRLIQFQAQADRAAAAARRMLLVGGAALAFFAKGAADAEEEMNRFREVFGSTAPEVKKFADTLGKAVQRSSLDIVSGLASFQGFFKGLGFGTREAAKLSQEMQKLSIDFASFNNLQDDEALLKFQSALAGETEAVRRFGINVSAVAVDQELLALGFKKISKGATEAQKAQARLNLMMKAVTEQGALGDAARTADSFANRMKGLGGDLKDLRVEIGQAFLPLLTKGIVDVRQWVGDIGEWTSANRALVTTLTITGAKVALLLVALPKLIAAMRLLLTVTKFTVASWGNFTKVMVAFAALAIVAEIVKIQVEIAKLNEMINDIGDAVVRAAEARKKLRDGGEALNSEQRLRLLQEEKTAVEDQIDSQRRLNKEQQDFLDELKERIAPGAQEVQGGPNIRGIFEKTFGLARTTITQDELKEEARLKGILINADERVETLKEDILAIEKEITAETAKGSKADQAAVKAKADALGQAVATANVFDLLGGSGAESVDDLIKNIGKAADAAQKAEALQQNKADNAARLAQQLRGVEEQKAAKEKQLKEKLLKATERFDKRFELLGKTRQQKLGIRLRRELEALIKQGEEIGIARAETEKAFMTDLEQQDRENADQDSFSAAAIGLKDASANIQQGIIEAAQEDKQKKMVDLLGLALKEQEKIRAATEETAKHKDEVPLAVPGP